MRVKSRCRALFTLPFMKARSRCKTPSMLLMTRWTLGSEINKGIMMRTCMPCKTKSWPFNIRESNRSRALAWTCPLSGAVGRTKKALKSRLWVECWPQAERQQRLRHPDPGMRAIPARGWRLRGEAITTLQGTITAWPLTGVTTSVEGEPKDSHWLISSLHSEGNESSAAIQMTVATHGHLWRKLWSWGPHQVLHNVGKPLFWRP